MNMAAAHSYNALPAWFTEAPSGMTKPAMRSDTLARCSRHCSDIGKVAEDDAVENAVSSAGAMAGYRRQGFTRPTSAISSGSATKAYTARPATTQAANCSNGPAPSKPETATTFAMSANTQIDASVITQSVISIMTWKMHCQKLITVH